MYRTPLNGGTASVAFPLLITALCEAAAARAAPHAQFGCKTRKSIIYSPPEMVKLISEKEGHSRSLARKEGLSEEVMAQMWEEKYPVLGHCSDPPVPRLGISSFQDAGVPGGPGDGAESLHFEVSCFNLLSRQVIYSAQQPWLVLPMLLKAGLVFSRLSLLLPRPSPPSVGSAHPLPAAHHHLRRGWQHPPGGFPA